MKEFFKLASDNPILVYFLVVIIALTLVEMTAIIVLHHTVEF